MAAWMSRDGPKTYFNSLEIMHLFSDHGELGVAQVWNLLRQRRKVARNTVQTMLTRLVERGWLHVRPEERFSSERLDHADPLCERW